MVELFPTMDRVALAVSRCFSRNVFPAASRRCISFPPFIFVTAASNCAWSETVVTFILAGAAFAENSVVLAVDETISAFGADPSALTLTGFSLGGMGTWNLSKIARGKFSRILCVCGTISTWVPAEYFTGCQLKIITGKFDGSVDAREERIYAESARRDGIDAEWIEYPSNHADTCSLVFRDMEILTWLRLYKEKEEAP